MRWSLSGTLQNDPKTNILLKLMDRITGGGGHSKGKGRFYPAFWVRVMMIVRVTCLRRGRGQPSWSCVGDGLWSALVVCERVGADWARARAFRGAAGTGPSPGSEATARAPGTGGSGSSRATMAFPVVRDGDVARLIAGDCG